MELVHGTELENLCSSFILPLIKLSKFSFPDSNFVECYLVKDQPGGVIVEVNDYLLCSRNIIHKHPCFKFIRKADQTFYIGYLLPPEWLNDWSLFIAGKYSCMSHKAKDRIMVYSRLPIREPLNKGTVTDIRLLALNREVELRRFVEQRYAVSISDDNELLSLPTDTSFLSLTTILKAKAQP